MLNLCSHSANFSIAFRLNPRGKSSRDIVVEVPEIIHFNCQILTRYSTAIVPKQIY